MARPRRLHGFSYTGLARYFVTICTYGKRQSFRDNAVATTTLLQFRQAAYDEKFAILAYCLMPDHVHLLVEGKDHQSNFRSFVKHAKQHSGAAHALQRGQRLWQEGYYERVLRLETDAREVARYILWNPVRAGLSQTPVEYPYLGSDVWSIDELLEVR